MIRRLSNRGAVDTREPDTATADNRNGRADLYLRRVMDRTDASRDTAAN